MVKGEKNKAGDGQTTILRTRAEKKIAQTGGIFAGEPDGPLQRLVHELQVHQIELEMQNEELRNAQVAVEESRHRYADLFDFAPVGYVTLDEAGIIQEINLTGSLMLGKERSFLVRRPFMPYLLAQDFKTFTDHLAQAFMTGDKTITEVSLAVKGGVTSVQLMSIPVEPAGQKPCLRMVISDISARKKVERELDRYRTGLEKLVEERTVELKNEIERHRQTENSLKERDENFERIMENSAEGILIVMGDGSLRANSRLMGMLGYAQDELSGMLFKELLPAESRETVGGRISGLVHGKEVSYRCETVFVSKGKGPVPVELTSVPINWHGRNASLVMVSDIAIRKSLEEELLRAQKLESLAVLAGGIAHDFNNMLTGILGNISMAEHDIGTDSKVHAWLKEAEKASLRAANLTKQLLTFSKGGAPLKESFSIGELLRESASFALSGSKVRCEFLIPDDHLVVEADMGQINQVIHNIVVNAEQAMPHGGVIRVGAEHLTVGPGGTLPLKEGEFVRFFVEDQGNGIAPENLHRIFDPYFTTKETGSGLGLASAYSIITRHGGYIGVISIAGGGTRVDVYLQASDRDVAVRHEASEVVVAGSGRILVMDDDSMIRDLAVEILKDAGYEVECAKDGREAIDLYKKAGASGRPFGLVIMDLTIPGGMGGKDAITELRALYPDVRAIVSSGYSNDPVMAEYEKYGFCGVVAKPYTPAAFTNAVKKSCGKAAADAAISRSSLLTKRADSYDMRLRANKMFLKDNDEI